MNDLSNTSLSEKDEKNTSLNAFGVNSIFSIIDQLKNRRGPFHRYISDIGKRLINHPLAMTDDLAKDTLDTSNEGMKNGTSTDQQAAVLA